MLVMDRNQLKQVMTKTAIRSLPALIALGAQPRKTGDGSDAPWLSKFSLNALPSSEDCKTKNHESDNLLTYILLHVSHPVFYSFVLRQRLRGEMAMNCLVLAKDLSICSAVELRELLR